MRATSDFLYIVASFGVLTWLKQARRWLSFRFRYSCGCCICLKSDNAGNKLKKTELDAFSDGRVRHNNL